MKLASYHDGSSDGQLIVVSRDLSTAHFATGIATRLQQVLDDWNFLSPQLEELYVSLNNGRSRHAFPFEPKRCAAPLPRAFQWVHGQAYPSHSAALAPDAPHELVLQQGSGDAFAGPTADIAVPSEKLGIDFEAGLAVVTGDVPMGVSPERALDGVRLVMLVNSIVLRQVASSDPVQGRPMVSFGPVAVTPDELGTAWKGGRAHVSVQVQWNGKRVGLCDAGPDMAFPFGQLVAHLAKTRAVRAGTVVGSGAIGNADASLGYASIAQKRALDVQSHGEARTDHLRAGDTVQVDAKGADGQSIFGAIDQAVAEPGTAES